MDMLTNKMTVSLNVFGALMKHRILGYLNSTAILTKERSSTIMGNS